MFSVFRVLRSLVRIARALEELRDLYRLDLASRGIHPIDSTMKDELEISYGYRQEPDDV